MKFRGKMIEISSIQQFTRILATIAKLAKTAVLRLTLSRLYFIYHERIATGGSSLWCEIPQDHFFWEFNMEGISEENNEIYLELNVENLVTAYRSAQAAKSAKLKLTKKHVPCLTLEVELPSLHSHSRFVVHDVPVKVIPVKLWSEYQEPSMADFDVSLYMPSLKVVRNVVERMKSLSSFMVLNASKDGVLNLKCETNTATITTRFTDLDRVTNTDGSQWAESRIDIRKLSLFLFGQQINPTKVICSVTHGRVVHFFLLHDDISMQYFLPSISP